MGEGTQWKQSCVSEGGYGEAPTVSVRDGGSRKLQKWHTKGQVPISPLGYGVGGGAAGGRDALSSYAA